MRLFSKVLLFLALALLAGGRLAAQEQDIELDSSCKWGLLWMWVKCDYPRQGPYGLSVGMNSIQVKDALLEVFEHTEIGPISAWKILGPGSGYIPGDLRDDEKLANNILWADVFTLDLRRFGRDGIVAYYLEDGSIVRITWEWSIDLP